MVFFHIILRADFQNNFLVIKLLPIFALRFLKYGYSQVDESENDTMFLDFFMSNR